VVLRLGQINIYFMKQVFIISILFFTVKCMGQNVGVGTTTPQVPLHIKNSTNIANEVLRLEGRNPILSFKDTVDGDRGTIASDNSALSLLTPNTSNISIGIQPKGIINTNFYPNGSVGIGTGILASPPATKLHIINAFGSPVSSHIQLTQINNFQPSSIRFNNLQNTYGDYWSINSFNSNSNVQDSQRLGIFNSWLSKDALTITGAGKVGIQNSAPYSPLTINHNANYSFPTPGVNATGAINIKTTADGQATGVTFSHYNGNDAQAGIYVEQSTSFGTKMHFATTNSYATGPQSRLSISPTGSIGIGNVNPNANASLDITDPRPFLPPRLTLTQRQNIINLIEGMTIYNTTTKCIEIYRGDKWFNICNSISSYALNLLKGGNELEWAGNGLQTTDGGFIIGGFSQSSANGDVTGVNHGGLFDYWILKTDSAGNSVWDKLLGGSNEEDFRRVTQTLDGGYIVTGDTKSSANGNVTGVNHGAQDWWIIRLDASGNILWNKVLGGSVAEQLGDVKQLADGGFLLVGNSSSSANGDITSVNHGAIDGWVVKINNIGTIVNSILFGGSDIEYFSSNELTNDGGSIVVGYSSSSANGDITSVNHGAIDGWLVKLNNNNIMSWNKLIGGSSNDDLRSIKQTTDGGYIAVGSSSSSANGDITDINHGGVYDGWIVKTDASGNVIWSHLFGGAADDILYSVIQLTDGSFIACGSSSSSNSGDITDINLGANDGWIIKVDASGNKVFSKLLGGGFADVFKSISQCNDGNYLITGDSGDTSEFTTHGGLDIWMFKINAQGIIQ
jgi:hypothetical protein